MNTRVVKNYPSPRLMETIGATNQKPAEAIGELVANSFDARLLDNKLNIVVDMRDSQIAVIDDGKGMTASILEKAVCIAEDMSKHIERGEETKGHFGMGFKTSCSTLGRFYEIYTRPESENREYHVKFDIADYSSRPSGADAWDITIEDYEPINTSPLGNLKNGTAFVISRLKDKSIVTSAVLTYLGEAFKGHLDTGDHIIIIDENGIKHDAIPKTYNFIKGTRIEIDETFGVNDKYHITGWAALDSSTHNDGLYGFNIYRHNQLVEKWDKSWFSAHLMTSRIIGEVNMDFLDATFYKQGIQQSEDWKIVSQHMKEFLKVLVSSSRTLSKSQNVHKPCVVRDVAVDLRKEYGDGSTFAEVNNDEPIEAEETNFKSKDKNTGINETFKPIVKEQSLVLEDEGEIQITYLVKETAHNMLAPYDYIFSEGDEEEEEQAELQVIMFKDHPLWKKKQDENVIKILATYDSIYRLLVEKLEFDTSEALKIRNEWIKKRTAIEEGGNNE